MAFTGKPQTYLDSSIENDAFYPSLSVGDFQRIYRVPTDRAPETIEHQLRMAKNEINFILESYKEKWVRAGYSSLQNIDDDKETEKVRYYLDAIFLKAKAELLLDFQTFSRRDNAKDMAIDDDSTHQALLANSKTSLRRVMGKRGTIKAALL